MTNKTNFQRVAEFLAACGKQPHNPAHISVQIGCHLEEFSEVLREITLESTAGISSSALQEVAAVLAAIGENLKRGYARANVYDRENMLKELCDCDVTGNGVAYLMGMQKDEADRRVLDSNDSKLVDGQPVLLPGGKIGKGPNYVAPSMVGLAPAAPAEA